jgi:hypothetical protein
VVLCDLGIISFYAFALTTVIIHLAGVAFWIAADDVTIKSNAFSDNMPMWVSETENMLNFWTEFIFTTFGFLQACTISKMSVTM